MMRILIKRRGAMGDVLNTTPVVRRLRQTYPQALISVETHHGHVYLNNPHADFISSIQPAIESNKDLIIDLNGVYERDRRCHQIDAYFKHAFGDTDGDKSVFLFHPTINPIYLEPRSYVVIHPNVSWPSRTFLREWWQEVANGLVAAGQTVVVTGTVQDHRISGDGIIDARSRLSLAQQASLIEDSATALCGPSGIATVVGATNAPLVVLCTITKVEYGVLPYRHGEEGWNTTPLITSMNCYGCSELEPPSEYYACRRGDNACVSSFAPEMVVEQTLAAIQNDRRGEL